MSGHGNCQRTLVPTTLQPSSMSTVSLTYALGKDHRDSLLFYLPAGRRHGNDKDVDFLALEMVDRKIRFLWNVGGGTQVLTHPLRLLPSPDDLSDDSRWYHIQARRCVFHPDGWNLNYFLTFLIFYNWQRCVFHPDRWKLNYFLMFSIFWIFQNWQRCVGI